MTEIARCPTAREVLEETARFHDGCNWSLTLEALNRLLQRTAGADAELAEAAEIGRAVMEIMASPGVRTLSIGNVFPGTGEVQIRLWDMTDLDSYRQEVGEILDALNALREAIK